MGESVKKEPCEGCNGHGQVAVNSGGPDGEEYVRCEGCDGRGYFEVASTEDQP